MSTSRTSLETELNTSREKVHGLSNNGGVLDVKNREILYEEVRKQLGHVGDLKKPARLHKPRRIYKPPSKRVGLTKIRMEDCLRCDACSCIYIDQRDYFKHMRNFHEKYNTMVPRIRRKSPTNLQFYNPCASTSPPEENFQDSKPVINFRETIKNRWSRMVCQQLFKKEPDESVNTTMKDDLSRLLCQVEVTIKTEPPS